MGRHVAPHRWADAAAGALNASQIAAMEEHADQCETCARARDRVRAAQQGFSDIRQGEAPRLNWEHIGARIYWVTSSERRAADRDVPPRRRRLPWIAGSVAMAAAIAVAAVALWPDGDAEPAAVQAEVPANPPADDGDDGVRTLEVELVTEATAARALSGLVTFRQGEVRVGGGELGLERVLRRGDVITTGADGRVTVQFGPASGFTLAPGSTLEVRDLTERAVELVLSGDVSVDVERRPSGQRFEVHAGDHVVAVRGTAFQVRHRSGELAVACARGKVAVRGPSAEREVEAGEQIAIAAGDDLASREPVALPRTAGEVLEGEVRHRMLPVWTDPASLIDTSAVLRFDGRGSRKVSVNDQFVGRGRFEVRVMPGKVHVDDGDGGRWVSAGAREVVSAASPATTTAPRDLRKDSRLRRRQLDKALGQRARRCMRSLEKQGLLEGSFVVFDIGVNRAGSWSHLNISKSNLPGSAARCIRSVIDGLRLPAGPRATLRYRVGF